METKVIHYDDLMDIWKPIVDKGFRWGCCCGESYKNKDAAVGCRKCVRYLSMEDYANRYVTFTPPTEESRLMRDKKDLRSYADGLLDKTNAMIDEFEERVLSLEEEADKLNTAGHPSGHIEDLIDDYNDMINNLCQTRATIMESNEILIKLGA